MLKAICLAGAMAISSVAACTATTRVVQSSAETVETAQVKLPDIIEDARAVTVSLEFLDGLPYEAQIYRDGVEADWRSNPYAFETAVETVDASGDLVLNLAPGGGTAIAFTPVE